MKNSNFSNLLLVLLIAMCRPCYAQIPQSGSQVSHAYKRLMETQHDYTNAVISGDSSLIAEMCYRLGKRYMGINNLYKSREWLLRSLQIRNRWGASEDLGKVYTRLYELEIWANHPNEAMDYARMAIANFNAAHSKIGLINGYRMMAGAHVTGWKAQKQNVKLSFKASIDSTFLYYDLAVREAEKQKLPVDIALTYECLSNAFGEIGDFKSQLLYQKKALYIYESKNLPYNIIALSTTIGKFFLQRSDLLEAGRWMEKIKLLTEQIKDVNETQQLATAELSAKYYMATGRWKGAFEQRAYADSLKIQQLEAYQKETYDGMNALLTYEKNQEELNSQKLKMLIKEQQAKLQLWISGFFLTLFLAAIGIGLFFYRRSRLYMKSTKVNAELVREQSHRISNNLQSVSDLIALNLENLPESLAKHALEESLLRVETICLIHRTLYKNDNLVQLNLNPFIPELALNVLQSYNFGLTQTIFKIENILLHIDQAIPLGLIINELVTNSCKHALPDHYDPWIKIQCYKKNNDVFFIYEDSGSSLNFEHQYKKKGFGSQVIDLLVNEIGGTYSTNEQKPSVHKFYFNHKKIAGHIEDKIVVNH